MASDLFWRENVAVANVVLQACLTFVFARHIWVELCDGGWRRLRQDQVTQGAIALATMNLGDCLYRFWVWAIIKIYNDGQSNMWVKAQWPWAVVASLLIFIGALCAIRVFSPSKWRQRVWLFAAALTIVALVANSLV